MKVTVFKEVLNNVFSSLKVQEYFVVTCILIFSENSFYFLRHLLHKSTLWRLADSSQMFNVSCLLV